MKTKNIMSVLFMAALLLFSCSEKGPSEEPDYSLQLETNIKNIDQDSTESVTVGVTTDDSQWTVKFRNDADKTWLTATPDIYAGYVKLQAKSVNLEYDMRTAILEVSTKSGKTVHELTVNQFGTGDVLRADKTDVPLERKGGDFSVQLTTNVEFEMTKPDWVETVQQPTRNLEDKNYKFSVAENLTGDSRTSKIEFKSKNITPQITATVNVTQKNRLDIDIPDDTRIKVSTARALNNEYNPSQPISLSYDDNLNTNYHSRYGTSTVFPVTLEYDMPAGTDRVDYIEYIAPKGNGAFGEIELWANTRSNTTFKKLMDYDCGMKTGAQNIVIPGGMANPYTFQFKIKTGASNVATCTEMRFYRNADPDTELEEAVLKVFKTTACMELTNSYTERDLGALPEVLYDVAMEMKEGTYPREFRCDTYSAYSNPSEWARKNKTNAFSILENPTGIEVEAGKTFYVLAGELYGNNISLMIVTDGLTDDETYRISETYRIREGVNEFTPKDSGQLYIEYYVSNLSATSAKPVEIHIPNTEGTNVFGYFSLAKHKTAAELKRLLALPDPIAGEGTFPILGTRVQWNFLKSSLRESKSGSAALETSLLEALNMWDDMIRWFWETMGIDAPQFPAQRNNKMIAMSTIKGYYMFAASHYIHIIAGSIPTRVNRATMFDQRDLMWGPAHEFGHELDNALTWQGQTESSNNLFSNMAIWYFGKKYGSPATTYGPGLWKMSEMTFDKKMNFMEFELLPNDDLDDPGLFLKARLYWQLYVYYVLAEKDLTFMPRLFAYMRQKATLTDPQQQSMNFYKNFCDFTQLDFTEFFQCWGYFNPIDRKIAQYGEVRHLLTNDMIKEAQDYVKEQNYAKAPPIQFIDDRNVTTNNENPKWDPVGNTGYYITYKDDLKVSSNVKYSKSGNKITITNGQNAVGFEIREGSDTGTIVYISAYYEFTSDLLTGNNKLYAVQADGARIEIKQ